MLRPKKHSKPITVYDYDQKEHLLNQWTTNATSLSTITGIGDRGYKLAKKAMIDGYGLKAPKHEINMISNEKWDQDFATADHQLNTAEYKSASLAGVKSVINRREDMYKFPGSTTET